MKQWDIIYEYCADHPSCDQHGYYRVQEQPHFSISKKLNQAYRLSLRELTGWALLTLGFGGMLGPFIPALRLETAYAMQYVQSVAQKHLSEPTIPTNALPAAVPVVFEPLTTPDGATIQPVNEEFALIVPKVGINAPITAGVNPSKPDEYNEVLKTSVAHASTSFLPDENGTVYLFSHSTNYDWFVSDLNAVFYLLKNLEEDDTIVIMYQGKRYTYKITGKKVVSPTNTSYLYPYVGHRNLILQTCWPPGSVAERLLIFANLIEEEGKTI
jgi:LPXTG-site transpeptidase (sortase) family protein